MNNKITKETVFADVLDKPEVVETLLESGMHCIGCPISGEETIGEGAVAHGIGADELIEKINKKLEGK